MSMTDLPVPMLIVFVIVILYLLNSIKILREYERGVIFRLGRALPAPKGPGIILVFRPIDQMVRISLRQEVLEVPPQDVITRDNVTIKVNAVVTLYVINPNDAAKGKVGLASGIARRCTAGTAMYDAAAQRTANKM